MTPQEIFDKGLAHIRKQGGPGVGPNNECAYTTSDHQHCVAWPFLKPEYQNADLLGSWMSVGLDYGIDEVQDHRHFIRHMQSLHDLAAGEARTMKRSPGETRSFSTIFMFLFEKAMKNFAEERGLIYRAA